ncbi:MAG: DUF1835 domain-containing protein [Deltaproteobacteria bacterium]|nr:DUF1835 domain-containing protein [Deltaproteobacteria bacterium]
MRSSTRKFVHLTSGEAAAEVISETLKLLGRDEPVLAMRDDYAEGPLRDADDGAASRVEWWTKLRGAPLEPDEARRFDDADLWAQVRAGDEDVLLWHGPHAMERIFALRACWRLRDQPERVHEVAVMASGASWGGVERPAFYDAITVADAQEAAAAWNRRAKVVDVDDRARRWEELRAREGEWIRVLDGEAIVHLPVTAFDEELLVVCKNGDWTNARRVLGALLADHPMSPELVCWRVRELVRAGVMEGRGHDDAMNLPREVRSADAVER